MIVRFLDADDSAERGADVPAILAEQLLALITEECAQHPVILVIDDLQWADTASVRLWGRLARIAGKLPLLLVGAMRPVPLRADLLALRRMVATTTVRLRLDGLTEPAIARLAARLAGGTPDGGLLRLAATAGGNPLYLTELIGVLQHSSMISVTDTGQAALAPGPVPDSLSAAIAERLGFVSGSVRGLLRAAGLLGVEFSVTDLATITGRSVPDLLGDLDEALTAGVLAESGNALCFRHPLIREALHVETTPDEIAAAHRDAGHALAAAGAPAHRVARQLLQAIAASGDPAELVDEWMLRWLSGAGDSLVTLAPAVAAELLDQAAASRPAGSEQHVWIASRLADALFRIGNRSRAEREATRAIEHATDPDVLMYLRWTLAQCRMLSGQAEAALSVLGQSLADSALPARHRPQMLALASRAQFQLGDVEQTERTAGEALASALETGDHWATGWALQSLAGVSLAQGRAATALSRFDQALAVTQADPALADLRLLLQVNQAVTLGDLNRHEQALSVAERTRDLAKQIGTTLRLSQAHGALSQLFFYLGRWDEALTETAMLLADLKEPACACSDFAIAAVIHFHRDEPAAARRQLAAAGPYATRTGHRVFGPLALAQALDREQDGQPGEALAVLMDALGQRAEGIGESEELLPAAARLAAATGDQAAARFIAGHAAEIAGASEIPHWHVDALYCQGLAEHDLSRLLTAAERYGECGRLPLKAQALEAAAAEAARAGDRESARVHASSASEAYASIGAIVDVARITPLL
jgi:tetratricopeptide (TPR) repeat protein